MSERARQDLPPRRLNLTTVLDWQAHTLLVTPGFDRDGIVREVFCKGVQLGSDLARHLDDDCILISTLLQSGYRAEELLAKLTPIDVQGDAARFLDDSTGVPKPSAVAALIAHAVRVELEDGDGVREAYAATAGRDPFRRHHDGGAR